MLPNSILSYRGAAVLELRDHDLIIWKGDNWDEVVRWKLNRLRSFKAKKNNLTILAGRLAKCFHFCILTENSQAKGLD